MEISWNLIRIDQMQMGPDGTRTEPGQDGTGRGSGGTDKHPLSSKKYFLLKFLAKDKDISKL